MERFISRKPLHKIREEEEQIVWVIVISPSLNPATEEVVALLPNSGPPEVEDAVRAAAGAFPAWSCLSPETRGRYLLKIADMIDSNLESLALAESRDQGKPVSQARSLDIPRAALNFR